MHFPANVSRNTTSILLNHTAQSLYHALHKGVTTTWAADSSTIKTPPNIDKSCLVQGFNVIGPRSIKSRVAVASQPLDWCALRLPYFVRGVGIGGFRGYPEISCGEIIIGLSYAPIKTYPAFCRIYIQ